MWSSPLPIRKSLGRKTRRTLVLGTGILACQVVGAVKRHTQSAYRLVGVIAEEDADPRAAEDVGCAVLGAVGDMENIVDSTGADCIVVAVSRRGDGVPERLLHVLLRGELAVLSAADVYEELTGKLAIDSLTPANFLFGRELRPSQTASRCNRVLSLCIAASGLLVTAPAMAFIALAIRLDSRGSVFFVQERVGYGGRRFPLFKFRSMLSDPEERSVWAGENSDRITRVGKWLRKFRLDELPQFINVMRGDMNIVGPRPHPSTSRDLVDLISRNLAECGDAVPYYSLRSLVRPGITGWAQVRYKYANGLGEELEKLRYDLYYVKHYSVWLDLRILAMTVAVVLKGDGGGRKITGTGAERRQSWVRTVPVLIERSGPRDDGTESSPLYSVGGDGVDRAGDRADEKIWPDPEPLPGVFLHADGKRKHGGLEQ